MDDVTEYLLVGNPNTGKTSLFNKLTKGNEHVGNWHGVTVEEKVGQYVYFDKQMRLVDLPGLYSLSTLSYEEGVARDYFYKFSEKRILLICDANNLARNLYLALNLIEYGCRLVIAVNNMDKVPKNKINYKKISEKFGVDFVSIDANKGYGLNELNEKLISAEKCKPLKYVQNFNLSKIKQEIAPFFDKKKLDYFATKCLERDEYVIEKLPKEVWEKVEELLPKDSMEMVARTRYEFISSAMESCVETTNVVYGRSKLDKIMMNKFLSLPIFLLLLMGVFYLTFFSIGKFLSDSLVQLVNLAGQPLLSWLSGIFGESSWIVSLLDTAIIDGIGTIFSFLPQVALLFLFLSILEDSGYLARVAFMFEDIFGKVGLSGKSVYTLLMGFGCSSSAILTARNMEDKNAKVKTALLTPYISCSAKFPLYLVIGGAFFGVNNIFYIMGLYLLGVVLSIFMSYIFEKTVLKSKEQSFILEFPPYRMPSFKRVGKVLYENVKLFIQRVGTLLISMNVIVWILSNFTFKMHYVPSTQGSMLETLGRVIAPIFIPLGFGSWGVSSSILAGIIAKEVIITSIVMFNGIKGKGDIVSSLTNPNNPVYFAGIPNVLSFLIFSSIYSPCVTTMAVLSKEIGKKWTWLGILIQFVVSYIVTLFFFNIFKAMESFGVTPVLMIILAFVVVLVSVFVVIDRLKKKKTCAFNCSTCGKCHKR